MYNYTEGAIGNQQPIEEKEFSYYDGWVDRLGMVNNDELTYDANGNVLTYGDREYTWTNGRNLSQITEGDNTYSYTYDENGIRTSKTVNGVTTYYNTQDGVILSQTDGTNTWYFQYDTNGTPLGFILNGNQYYYITNISGDIIEIANGNGLAIAEYFYDPWGNAEYVVTINSNYDYVANANPLRYRGYYYDNETGYYYLQSRYYDPSICRFINADVYDYLDINTNVGKNLFAYCGNDPVNNIDPCGNAYSPAKAQAYADKWWNGTNSSYYCRYSADCANFVSQCLYAGNLSKQIKTGPNEWFYEPDLSYNYTYMSGPLSMSHVRRVYHAKYSSSWVLALELGKWLYKNFANKNNNRFYYITDLKTLNVVGKKLYNKPTCSAVILLQWKEDGKTHYHIMLSGYVRKNNENYYIYTYGHTNDRDGKVTNGKYVSMQYFLNKHSGSNKIIRVYFLN